MSDANLIQIERRKRFTENEFWEMFSDLIARMWDNLLPPQLSLEDLPTKRSKNFVTPVDAPVPDCLTCGACCTFLFSVGVKSSDEPPPELVWEITDASGEIVIDCYIKRDSKTLFCAALKINQDGSKPCSIYESRPQTCRNFEAGSDKCHALRRAYGFEPFLTLQEMFDAQQKVKTTDSSVNQPDTVRDVKIIKNDVTGEFEITLIMSSGVGEKIHTFNPRRESWRQFQFFGSTLDEARQVINSQMAKNNI